MRALKGVGCDSYASRRRSPRVLPSLPALYQTSSQPAALMDGGLPYTVTIQDPAASEPREPRYRTLVDTGKAQLKLSTHGLFRKVEIRLRSDEASRIDFQREMNTLFDEELIGRYL